MDFRVVEKSYTCRITLNNGKNNQTPGKVLLQLVVVTIFNLYIHKTDKKKKPTWAKWMPHV